jgi:anti-sigma factor RsiW
MSVPLKSHQLRNPGDDRLIDQLVDGELPDTERRDLLLRLENAPDGWRRCALAFLEAQAWCEALGPLAAARRTGQIRLAGNQHRQLGRWYSLPRLSRLSALAAGFALVFASGWALHRGSSEKVAPAPSIRTEAPPSTPSSQSGESAAIELPGRESAALQSAGPALLDEAAQLWEQRGYQTERESRVISMELKDGRRLDMPIEEVRVQYIGNRTY